MTLINREDAIDELRHLIPYRKYHRGEWVYLLEKKEVFKTLNSLPSVNNSFPQGEWIDTGGDSWVCSNCGVESYVDEDFRVLDKRAYKMNFCHYCGANMRSKKNENRD